MGFGHRVYKNYDPRATIIKGVADEVFRGDRGVTRCSTSRLSWSGSRWRTSTSSATSCTRNVDFYSGIIYQAMGFPVAMFPGAVRDRPDARAGWPHWQEGSTDKEQKIARAAPDLRGRDHPPPQRQKTAKDGKGGEGA